MIESRETLPNKALFEGSLLRKRPIARANGAGSGPKSTAIERRIDFLKILALTLLREIQCLEIQSNHGSSIDINVQDEVRHFEAEFIRSALIRTGGRQRRAARLLGMKVTTLNAKIKRYGITLTEDDLRVRNGSRSERAN